ncbi:dimer_Tnp_hAT domain-containing protein [Trichonephila clavipes]|nr:dimer_Tnp_hAT domain-containing protein [Trichonephila clavipes]
MYPDVISFDKLNLSQFDWLEIEELEMQLIDFQSSSIWIQKFIETRKKFELIEAESLTSNLSKNTSNEILEIWNSIPDAFNCLKKLQDVTVVRAQFSKIVIGTVSTHCTAEQELYCVSTDTNRQPKLFSTETLLCSARIMHRELQMIGMHNRVPVESRVALFCIDGRRQICREPHKAMDPSCPTRTVQGSGGSTMIWSTFCWHEKCALVFLKGK